MLGTNLDKSNEIMLSETEVINGLLLSDASIEQQKNRKNARFRFHQKTKHSDLCGIVYDLFNKNGIGTNLNYYGSTSKLWNGKIHEQIRCLVYTKSMPYFTKLREKWYQDRKKIVPKDLIITPMALAFWYMGDGFRSNEQIGLCTDNFSLYDHLILAQKLNKLSLNVSIVKIKPKRKFNKTTYRIFILKKSQDKFIELIEPYITSTFNYKLVK